MLAPMRVYCVLAAVLLAVACGSDEAPGTVDTPASDTPTQGAGYRIGDTTVALETYKDFSLTFLSGTESPTAVDGPYEERDYYTFTALSGRKFLVLTSSSAT